MTTPQNPYGQGGPGGPQQPGGYPQQGGNPQQGGYPQQGGHQQHGGHPQQPGYPPAAPPLSSHELNRPPRPKSVDTAFLLFMISAGLGILSSIFSFITAKEAAEAALKPLRDAGIDTSTAAAAEPSYGTAIFSLILFAVWILIVFQMRNGANWARITLTVLGGLSIIFGLLGLLAIGILFSLGIFGVIQGLFSIIQLALTIGALVFMFKPDANHYFKAS